ncbi:MAG: hypothetical protein KJ799_11770 [Bacteroidetes bacterium]|nr:hypothetical protein [Bacteroidota bacterium]MBU1680412.1 hypothetical protein [Bacteroidota bacterium]MBU2507383.1 hypothetical protein [Bacteroidota bacterium]
MIEFKITNSEAVTLLTEKMRLELDLRKEEKQAPQWAELENLSFKELLKLAETASFDLIATLPPEFILEENNLDHIILNAMITLGNKYSKEQFNLYTLRRANNLIKPLKDLFNRSGSMRVFTQN